MTTRTIAQCRKAYRHIISDTIRLENREIGKVYARKRMQYFESFPVQVRRVVMGG